MFGWKQVERHKNETPRFGCSLELLSTGQWFELWFGRSYWVFTRYSRNRHTGPEDNQGVLGYFLRGPERRSRDRDFNRSFRTPRPTLSREEIMRRNREALASGKFKAGPLFVQSMDPQEQRREWLERNGPRYSEG